MRVWQKLLTTDVVSAVAPATYFPMSNTATDPTSATWLANNPGYVFVPNDGIYTATPMTDMRSIFQGKNITDADVGLWDVSGVTNMENALRNATFNIDISAWDTSSVTNMSAMFRNTVGFNRDLSGWCVSLIPSEPPFFQNVAAWVLPKPVWGTCP